jgi:outer membrane receptor protein involved in Fe transport
VTYALAADYRDTIGAARINYHVGYSWRSNYEGTLDNAPGTRIEAFGILDASVSYEQGGWSLALFGRNLTNEVAYSHTFSVVPNKLGGSAWKFATPRTPRNYGLQLTYQFD